MIAFENEEKAVRTTDIAIVGGGLAGSTAAAMLGRFTPGTILWCRQPLGMFDAPPYAAALAAWFDPARLLVVTVRREEDLFWAMEEGLRTPGIAAVMGETRAADPTAGRRLSLAAEKSGVPALLLRAQPATLPANAVIQRCGLRMNAVGDIKVEWPPYTAGKPIIDRPMS